MAETLPTSYNTQLALPLTSSRTSVQRLSIPFPGLAPAGFHSFAVMKGELTSTGSWDPPEIFTLKC